MLEDRPDRAVELSRGSVPVGADDDAVYGVAVAESSFLIRTATALYCVRESQPTEEGVQP